MVYLIRKVDAPNTAAENRFLGFAKNLKEIGLDFQIVFISTTPSLERNKFFEDYNVNYLWKDIKIKNQEIRKIWHFLCSRFFCKFSFERFCRKLTPGDKVVIFDGNTYIHRLLQCKGVKVYIERTEHPEVIGRLKTTDLMQQYINDCRKLEGIFVISTSLKKYFEGIGVNTDRIHIINMTVDPKRFEGVKKQDITERYIAYCGTVSNNKDGVDYLIRSFALVAKRIPDVKLYIMGKIPSVTEKAHNLRLIEENDIKERVVMTGMIPAAQMPQMLVNAEVCALARPDSLQAENGFPTKLGEYLLSRNPVVITRTGDIPLLLKNGKDALLCEERNIEEFADKLCWVLEHPNEAKIIGSNGEHVALKHFNSLTESKKIYKVLKNY